MRKWVRNVPIFFCVFRRSLYDPELLIIDLFLITEPFSVHACLPLVLHLLIKKAAKTGQEVARLYCFGQNIFNFTLIDCFF